MPAIKVFITGATGYIGGSVFSALAKRQEEFEITAYVRDGERAKKLQEFGVKTLVGTLDDFDIIANAAEASDIVIHTAESADHVNSAKAIIAGLKRRTKPTNTGRLPIYIHTSGTGVIQDKALGQFKSDKIYDDSIYADTHENIADDAIHRNVDFLVYEAGKSGQLDAYIVCPPHIYGTGTGPFNRDSIQIPVLAKALIEQKRAAHVGLGVNIWSNVHIEDLVDFYMLLLDKALKDEAPKNDNGYYFVESGESSWKDIAAHIGKALKKFGVIEDENPVAGKVEEFPQFAVAVTSGNSRAKAVKARQLGWKPHRSPVGDSIEETVSRILNNKKN